MQTELIVKTRQVIDGRQNAQSATERWNSIASNQVLHSTKERPNKYYSNEKIY
jgi:hypothetical protein